MAEEQLRKWINSLPKSELNKPIMSIGGKYLSPIDIAQEVNKQSELGMQALKKAQELASR